MDKIRVIVVSLLSKESSSSGESNLSPRRNHLNEISSHHFHISLTYGSLRWEIDRGFTDILQLSSELKSLNPCEDFQDLSSGQYLVSDSDSGREKVIEEFLNSILEAFGESIWNCTCLVRFLDVIKDQSVMHQILITSMANKIEVLERKGIHYETEIDKLHKKCSQLFQMIQSAPEIDLKLVSKVSDDSSRKSSTDAGSKLQLEMNSPNNETKGFNRSAVSSASRVSNMASASPGSYLLEISDDSAVNNIAPQIDAEYNSSDDEDDSETSSPKQMPKSPVNNRHNGVSPMRVLSTPNNSQYFTPTKLSLNNMWEADSESASPKKGNFDRFPSQDAACKSLPSSKFVSSEALLVAVERSSLFDQAVQEIIMLIQPHEAQFQYRASAIGLLRKQIRSTLSANTFDISLHEVRCFLPDDSLKLSVIVSKSHVATWQTSLIDHFTLLAERATLHGGNYSSIYQDDDSVNIGFGGNLEEYKALCCHIISNVSLVSGNANSKAVFNIDSMEVEVSANNRNEICMLAFIEEFSTLVGNDNLFKRSVLLIRAWWNYESASYVGGTIKHYLADIPQCIMICAIFNQYHAQIRSPFQALCYFLIEYAEYDGASQAITLQGLAPLTQQGTTNQVMLSYPQSTHLVTQQLITKYWQVFNANQSGDSQWQPVKNSSSSEDPNSQLAATSIEHGNQSNSSSIHNMSDNYSSGNMKSPKQSFYRSNSNSNVFVPTSTNSGNTPVSKSHVTAVRFDRMGFNIVHPFNYSNMVVEKMTHRRVTKIAKAFQIGAANLSVALKQSLDVKGTAAESAGDSIKKYFPALMGRYYDLWRPDAIGNIVQAAPAESLNDLLNCSMSRIWQSILYCNLVIESIVTENALITLSIEILADKGPLPVGEIGKILAELTSIPNLSMKLKEKFGGLKKFLERFPDKIFISNDHPFNPNVVLRSTLSQEHLDLIDKGLFPMQMLLKSKKNAANKKQLVKSGSFQNSRGDSFENVNAYVPSSATVNSDGMHTALTAHHPIITSQLNQSAPSYKSPYNPKTGGGDPASMQKYLQQQHPQSNLQNATPSGFNSMHSPIASNNFSGKQSLHSSSLSFNGSSNLNMFCMNSPPASLNGWGVISSPSPAGPSSQSAMSGGSGGHYTGINNSTSNDYGNAGSGKAGNNNSNNNMYLGTGNANSNSRILSSLRDGSSELLSGGNSTNNNEAMQFYSPSRLTSSSQQQKQQYSGGHKKTISAGSYISGEFITNTESLHHDFGNLSPYNPYSRNSAVNESASLLSSLADGVGNAVEDYSGIVGSSKSRLSLLSDVTNTVGGMDGHFSLDHQSHYGSGALHPNSTPYVPSSRQAFHSPTSSSGNMNSISVIGTPTRNSQQGGPPKQSNESLLLNVGQPSQQGQQQHRHHSDIDFDRFKNPIYGPF